jgi:hypothetical protein
MSTVAVFVALGGSSYAALKVTGKDARRGRGPEQGGSGPQS